MGGRGAGSRQESFLESLLGMLPSLFSCWSYNPWQTEAGVELVLMAVGFSGLAFEERLVGVLWTSKHN